MKISEALSWAVDYLTAHKIDDQKIEAEYLLGFSLNYQRPKLLASLEREITLDEFLQFGSLIYRRSKHEPTAYLTGWQPFMSLDFSVDRSVLIPRPETERLVEQVIATFKKDGRTATGSWRKITIADIGTGSGAIAVSLAKSLPDCKIIATDISAEAITVAHKNARLHGVLDRCEFRVGNMLEVLTERVDFIISNPPYIPSPDLQGLQPEVKDWEPTIALDGGPDGLTYIRKIINESPRFLKSAGAIFFEFGYNQAETIVKLMARYREIEVIPDYAKIPRVIQARVNS